MIKKKNIPTLLGIVILVAGTFAGVFFLGMKQVFKIGADTSVQPSDIRVSNVADNTVTISWTTDKPSTNFLMWGESAGSTSRIDKETEDDQKFSTHSITLSGLKPNTRYFYKINSGGETFDNKGIPWEFTTGDQLPINSSSSLVSGSVITPAGQPVARAIVYLTVNGYLFSTVTSDAGNFVFQLAYARDQDLSNYQEIDDSQTLLQISVVAGLEGNASAQIFPQSARPVPPIILGQVYDLRNLGPSSLSDNPSVNLNLPENINKESKFSIPVISGTPTPTSVILESLKEGEIITSDKPAFFGRGPKGESITITVQSDPITETIQIANDGTWSWSPPTNLQSGTHTITVSWVDGTGITRNIVRSFVVQAGEAPSFEATPSQTLNPSPSAEPTTVPSSTPTPTSTPIPTVAATPVPVPVTGVGSGTLMMMLLGFAITTFGFIIWKYAEN